MYGKDEKCIQNLVGKFEGKRPFQKPTCIWDSNIIMNLQERAVEGCGLVKGLGDFVF
jgi:hypothetical protein